MVLHEVLVGPEYTGGFHGTTSLWTQNTLHHDPSFHVEGPAIIANPVVDRDLVYAIASLVDRDVAISAEYYQILVFVIAIVADSTLGILLDYEASFVCT